MTFINSFFKYSLAPVVFSIISILYFIFPNEEFVLRSLIIYSAILMIHLFIRTLSIKEINLFILFSFSYIVPLFYYSFGHKIITSYSHSNQLVFLNKYAFLFALFFTVILILLPGAKQMSKNIGMNIEKKNNFLIFYINIVICTLIAFFSKSGESLLSSGGYGQSEITSLGGFAIGEYFLIFFYAAFKFSGTNKRNQIILLGVAGIFILKSLAFGLRNEFIQLSILLFILYYKENGKSFTYFVFILAGLYFSSLFASFRSNPVSFLESSIIENLSLKGLIDNESDYYISHQGDVVHSSSRLINFRDNKITSSSTIYSSALFFFSSSVVPQKYLPPQANMAAYRQADYPIGGGGNIFAYFYFWFWYPGVILAGCIIGLLIRNYKKFINSLYAPYFILVFSTFPRWFSYSPINLFKLCLYGFIIYCIYIILDIYSKKKDASKAI